VERLQVEHVTGNHYTLLDHPNVARLAERVRAHLELVTA
jgi:thioesterase domain-containing protein